MLGRYEVRKAYAGLSAAQGVVNVVYLKSVWVTLSQVFVTQLSHPLAVMLA